jgi:hypothetical protein
MASASRCRAMVSFWYNREEYDVYMWADSSGDLINIFNTRHVLLQFESSISTFFSYTIERACKNQDDCARNLITNIAIEMLQRQYNYSLITNEVQPFVVDPSIISNTSMLNCYDSNQNVYPCGTLTRPGSCVMSHTITQKKISTECDTEQAVGNAYVSIYQSTSDFTRFSVHCNRSLCNTHSTLQGVKDLMFKHNVTVTADGRLNGSRLMISTSLMIMMICIVIFNR